MCYIIIVNAPVVLHITISVKHKTKKNAWKNYDLVD